MSTFNETITPTNAVDKGLAERGIIPPSEVRTVTLDACVDTGAWTLIINEEIRSKLGLKLEGSVHSTLADGSEAEYGTTEGIELRWKERKHILPACVIPTADDILLGALPMDALDVYPDPVDEYFKGRHGDKALYRIK